MEQKHHVLVVDDDREIASAIGIYLKQVDLSVMLAYDGLEALEILENADFQLIIMDIMMPKLDGIQAMLKIRAERNIPIILLSAKSEDTDKILGLTMGADDYITKPFNPLELIARVKSQLRRYTTFGAAVLNSTTITTGSLSLDTELKLVTVDGEEIKFTPIEFKIFRLLMQNLGRIFSIDEIYERVWDELNINGQNTVALQKKQ